LKQFSKLCYLDTSSASYPINEAFTFDYTNLNQNPTTFELEFINSTSKEAFARSRVEYSSQAFANQVVSGDIMPVDGFVQPLRQSRMRQAVSRISIESLNSNGNNPNSRRKLPTLPPAKQLPQIPLTRNQSNSF